jgi:hypothetical protein
MNIFLLSVAFSGAAFFAFGFAQTRPDDPKPAQAAEACFDGVQTVRDSAGTPIVLTTKQLDERANRRVSLKYPPLLRSAQFETHGRIKILIAASGEVTCAVALSGHPVVLPNVLDAVMQWRFRPFEAGGRRMSVLGYFDFCFSSSGCPFMDFQFKPH